jgi:hypothetical protein
MDGKKERKGCQTGDRRAGDNSAILRRFTLPGPVRADTMPRIDP